MSIQSSETTVRVFLVETDRLVPYTEFSATALRWLPTILEI
jgi:hypothetical protein